MLNEIEQGKWNQALTYAQHSGLKPEDLIKAVKEYQHPEKTPHTLELTEKEYIFLRRALKELNAGLNSGWTATEPSFRVSLNEALDLKAIERKLWYSKINTEETHTEGTF